MNTNAKFLPAGFSMPKTGSDGYMKLVDGENRFRILSSPIFGYEEWGGGLPQRYKTEPKTKEGEAKPAYFMAMIVWNVLKEKIEILQIKQVTIIRSIMNLCSSEDWGSPFNYDIKITRNGVKKDTKYVVTPTPHKPVHEYVIEQFYANPIWLDALYESANPFSNHGKVTPTPFSRPVYIDLDGEITSMRDSQPLQVEADKKALPQSNATQLYLEAL